MRAARNPAGQAAPVAVVTGGAGVLGVAIARRLAEAGSVVVMFDIDGPAVEKAAARMRAESGLEVLAWQVDVSDEDCVREAVDRLASLFGRLDQLVNNAAVNPRSPLGDIRVRDWDAAMAVNLRAPMLLCRAALPLWQRADSPHGGRVVNIASRTWLSGGPAAYTASKAGIVGLTRALALELGPLGVTVNAVAPSMVVTPFTRNGRSDADFEALVQRHQRMTPIGRLAEPRDVANAVAFLASAEAGFITGEVLHVCGGAQLAAAP